jgi:WD40 repeat protein
MPADGAGVLLDKHGCFHLSQRHEFCPLPSLELHNPEYQMPTVAPLDLDGHCLSAGFLGEVPFFSMADGTIHRLDHGHKYETAHDGLLCADFDAAAGRLITGGEDGKVVVTKADGTHEMLANAGRKWVTSVAGGPQGAVAWAVGRSAFCRLPDGKVKEFQHPRTVEGLAFSPKGMRFAVARYNGVTLHFPATEGKPAELEWAGAHTGVTFSPDGAFLVTTMQENALHGWKLADGKHMRMSGYPAKVKSLSWSVKGKWLASSGAPAAIVWPFTGRDGPMGKAPLEIGTRGNMMVTAVACHPTEEVAAIGYADGMILAGRFADQKEVLLRRPGKGAVTSMMWDKEGRRVAFGGEAGDCGVVDVAG